MHFLLFYEKIPEFAELQKPLIAAHRAYLSIAVQSGQLLLGGSLDNPVDGAAVLVLEAPDCETVERFAQEDPYVRNGIVNKWWVRGWDVVVGSRLPG